MDKQILDEIFLIKTILSKLIGTSDGVSSDRFSNEALNKAATEFQKMSIERGDWISENNLNKYIKDAPYNGAGKFIRENFEFKNYFKKGRTYYYNKIDLLLFSKELKERNINLGRYMEYIEDRFKFKKSVSEALLNTKTKGTKKHFKIPTHIKNITSQPAPLPSSELIKADLKSLKDEFFQFKLSEYIDIYNGTHAMVKFVYHFEKYISPEIKRRANKWCTNFNYANTALELVTKKKEVFVPVKDDDMIQL
jgi:hypothetical protein